MRLCRRVDVLFSILATTGLVMLLPAQPALAQVRAFAAIKYLVLDPPTSGTEKVHLDIAKWLRPRQLLVESLDRIPSADRSLFARCRLRADLPRPHTLAFECVDSAGAHVGTKKFTSAKDWRPWFEEQSFGTHADARPLHTTRFVLVERFDVAARAGDDPNGFRASVEEQLRAGGLTVVDSTEGLSDADLTHNFLRCSIRPLVAGRGDLYYASAGSSIVLIDSAGRTVRHFVGWVRGAAFLSRDAVGKRSLRDAVRKFLEARVDDADIYSPQAPLPPK